MMTALAASTAAVAVVPVSTVHAETIIGQGKDRTSGTLTVHRQNTDMEPIQGAEFSIYKIMDVTPGATVGTWATSTFTNEFRQFMADNGVTADVLGNFSAAQTEGLVDKLAQFVGYGKNGVKTATAKGATDANGSVTFSDLSLGWYLVIESNPVETSGQQIEFAVRPFIVSIPTTGLAADADKGYGADGSTYVDGEDGDDYNNTRDKNDEFAGDAWLYDVVATPKATTITIDKNITNAQAAKDADYVGSNNSYITNGTVYKDKRDTVGYADIIEYTVETRVPEYADTYFTAKNDGTTTADVPVKDANANGRAVFVITDKLSKGLTVLQPTTGSGTIFNRDNAKDVILKRKINTVVTSDQTTNATNGTYTEETTKAYVKVFIEDPAAADGWTEIINPETDPITDLSGKNEAQLYTVSVLSAAEQQSDNHGANLTVRFTDHFLQSAEYRGKQMKVVYYAQVNQDAVMGTAGNTNDVVLTYSDTPYTNMWISPVEGSNPNHTPVENPAEGTDIPAQTGDGVPDAIVYTYGIQIDKFTEEVASQTGSAPTALQGAKFKLYADVDLTKEVVGSAVTDGVDKVLNHNPDTDAIGYDETGAPDGSAVFTTDANGAIAIPTLDTGTYYLKEVQAPKGYSLLVNPIKIEIVPNEAADGKIIDGSWRMFINGEEITVDNGNNVSQIHQADGQAVVAVENHRGFTLPTTGGTGIIVTVAVAVGGILVLNFCMLRKKNSKEEK